MPAAAGCRGGWRWLATAGAAGCRRGWTNLRQREFAVRQLGRVLPRQLGRARTRLSGRSGLQHGRRQRRSSARGAEQCRREQRRRWGCVRGADLWGGTGRRWVMCVVGRHVRGRGERRGRRERGRASVLAVAELTRRLRSSSGCAASSQLNSARSESVAMAHGEAESWVGRAQNISIVGCS